jgi:hypothetical protein
MVEQVKAEEIWVTTTEASEITGYDVGYLQKLANKLWKQPEGQRVIKLRSRSRRYELWLPDLVEYMTKYGTGPYQKADKPLDKIQKIRYSLRQAKSTGRGASNSAALDKMPSQEANAEENWVNVTEGGRLSGYNRSHVQKLARENWAKPEAERFIPVRRHTNGYMLWLPALLKYRDGVGYGPYPKRKRPLDNKSGVVIS